MSTDEELLIGIQQNEHWAWKELMKTFSHPLQSFLRTLSCKDEDFKDVFQETLMRFDANCQRLVLQVSLTTYLTRIAKNVWYEILRKRKQLGTISIDEIVFFEKLLDDDDIQPNRFEEYYEIDEDNDYFIDNVQVIEAVKKIHLSHCSNMIFMRFWHNESWQTIADELGLTRDSAESKMTACKKALKEILENLGIKFHN